MKSRKGTKCVLAVAVLAALGTAGAVTTTASANVIADGTYNMVINTTPTFAVGSTIYNNVGSAGAWNSSFTFGGNAPSGSSQAMTDNGTSVPSNGGNHGSGIAGDGWAGIIGIDVTGSTFTVNGASNVASMSGTINQTSGDMTFNPTGRLGTVSAYASLYDEAWNIDNCDASSSTGCTNNGNTAYQTFSTVSATALAGPGGASTTIHGTPFTAITDGYQGTLVSGGQVGSAFGGFFGNGYFEVWNVDLLPTATPHSGFNVDTVLNTAGGNFAQYVAPVPIPAAAWLFGSGLIGLVGVARRKKSS